MDRNGMKTDSKYLPVSTWTLNIMYEEGFSAVDPLLNQLGSSATYWSFFSKAESNLNFRKASEKSYKLLLVLALRFSCVVSLGG